MTDDIARGVCCHEAGHAVVAWSFRLPVKTVWVAFNETQGWHGRTEIDGSDNHLPMMDRIANLVAGKTAERLFGWPAHDKAWLVDFGEIHALLNRNSNSEYEICVRIGEASNHVRQILETHRCKVLALVECLIDHGRIENSEFLFLMDGKT